MRADPWSTTKAQAVFESSEINFYSFLHYNCLRLRPHCGGGNWKGSFHSENVWNVFRPHYAGGIWKRKFTLKAHRMFSVHTAPEEFKNATISGHFGFVFEENSFREVTWLSWRHCFRKNSVFKVFSVHAKTKRWRFQISPVWRAFS